MLKSLPLLIVLTSSKWEMVVEILYRGEYEDTFANIAPWGGASLRNFILEFNKAGGLVLDKLKKRIVKIEVAETEIL